MIKYEKNVKSVHICYDLFFFSQTKTIKQISTRQVMLPNYVRSDESDLGAGVFNLKV